MRNRYFTLVSNIIFCIFVLEFQTKRPVQVYKVCDKIMNKSNNLNPYKIVWGITVSKNGKSKCQHYPNIEKLKRNISGSIGDKIYIITDKQYGLIQNTYNGSVPELQKPFTHSLLLKNNGINSLVPLTKKQFENPIVL